MPLQGTLQPTVPLSASAASARHMLRGSELVGSVEGYGLLGVLPSSLCRPGLGQLGELGQVSSSFLHL